MQTLLLITGAVAIVLWGIGHLIPTRGVVSGFGSLSADNERIITMEWIAEGLTLCFLGVLVLLAVVMLGSDGPATFLVARASAGMLLVLATVSAFTGARTSVLPMKLCPIVKSTVAALFVIATFV